MKAWVLSQLNWYIFTRWQWHLGCLGTITASVKSKTSRVAVSSIYKGNVCTSTQGVTWQRSRADLTSISQEQILMIRWVSSLPPWHIFRCCFILHHKCIALYIWYLSGEIIEFKIGQSNSWSGQGWHRSPLCFDWPPQVPSYSIGRLSSQRWACLAWTVWGVEVQVSLKPERQ